MSKSAVEFLRGQFKAAHDVLEGTVADVSADQAHWLPPGVANPLGATYVHVLIPRTAFLMPFWVAVPR